MRGIRSLDWSITANLVLSSVLASHVGPVALQVIARLGELAWGCNINCVTLGTEGGVCCLCNHEVNDDSVTGLVANRLLQKVVA